MIDTKVLLSITLPGRVMYTVPTSEKVEKDDPRFDDNSLRFFDQKTRKPYFVNFKTRGFVPAKQTINLSEEAYKGMISPNEVPYWIRGGKKVWLRMSNTQRLEEHLSRIAEGLNGISYSYDILMD